jgi:hypothetical protein
MNSLYARSVFFTQDAEASLRHYTEQLGFSVDWKYDEEGRAYVFQVSLLGFELILNQTEDATRARAGKGRVFASQTISVSRWSSTSVRDGSRPRSSTGGDPLC